MCGEKERKKAVLEEVGLHPILSVTDPGKLCELLADDSEKKGRHDEANDLRAKSEQLNERGVK